MVITAWAFVVQAGQRPTYARERVMMRGDNQIAVDRVTKRMGCTVRNHVVEHGRVWGGLETRSGWCFATAHIAGVASTPKNGMSRWDNPSTSDNSSRFRADVCWRAQVLGQAGAY